MTPGALHTELWIFSQSLAAVREACGNPAKPIVVTDEVHSAATDMLNRWKKSIEPALTDLLAETTT